MSKKYIIHSWTTHTNLSLFNNISLLPPQFFGRFINKFFFFSIKHGYSQMNIQKTWKKPSRFSKGEKRDKNEWYLPVRVGSQSKPFPEYVLRSSIVITRWVGTIVWNPFFSIAFKQGSAQWSHKVHLHIKTLKVVFRQENSLTVRCTYSTTSSSMQDESPSKICQNYGMEWKKISSHLKTSTRSGTGLCDFQWWWPARSCKAQKMEIFLQHIKGREKQHNSNKEQENKNGKLVDEVFHSSLHTVVHSKSISCTMPWQHWKPWENDVGS